jgi:hypothetical protein
VDDFAGERLGLEFSIVVPPVLFQRDIRVVAFWEMAELMSTTRGNASVVERHTFLFVDDIGFRTNHKFWSGEEEESHVECT